MPPQDRTCPGGSFVLVTACDSSSGEVTSPSMCSSFFETKIIASGPLSPSGRHMGNQQLKKKVCLGSR